MFFSRLPQRGECGRRDQCPGYQPAPDLFTILIPKNGMRIELVGIILGYQVTRNHCCIVLSCLHAIMFPLFPGYLRGVDVIAETSVQVTNQSQTFHWAGYGLKLHIPQGALPAGLNECRLLIKVGLSGQFALPENTSLVSAVYWLDSEPRCKFSQPLTLEVQHCVKPTHTSTLSFIHAKCSQKLLPYVFEPVEGGEFSSESSYGCVELDHFSLLGVGCNDPIAGVRLYRACLFYLSNGADLRDIHFVITWDEEPHTTVSQCALCRWSLLY